MHEHEIKTETHAPQIWTQAPLTPFPVFSAASYVRKKLRRKLVSGPCAENILCLCLH